MFQLFHSFCQHKGCLKEFQKASADDIAWLQEQKSHSNQASKSCYEFLGIY